MNTDIMRRSYPIMEKYKLSKYNLFFKYNEKMIVYNALSNALAELDDDCINLLDTIKTKSCNKEFFYHNLDILENLKNALIIIDEDIEELDIIKNRYYAKADDYLHLIIAPTLKCNFNCFYCYEEKDAVVISKEVQSMILRIIENNAMKKRNISVDWYGGEPMLVKNIIFSMSKEIVEICSKYNVKYTANMITNGFLIKEEDISNFKLSNISSFQITVDGDKSIHNERRKVKSGLDSYHQIIKTIKMLIKNHLYVKVRINIDKENYLDNKNLLKDLSDLDDKYLIIRFGKLKDFECSNNCRNNKYFSTKEFSEVFYEKQKELYEKGFFNSAKSMYPQLKRNRCVADALNSYVVGPYGELYSCIADVGIKTKIIGHIQDYQVTKNIINNPFENEKCINCFCLPICMGSCPKDVNQKRMYCEIWRYNIKDIVKTHYIYNIEK